MKQQTQRQRIIKVLQSGWTNSLYGYKKTGSLKFGTRAMELLLLGYKVQKKWDANGEYRLYRIVK
jgi:hypothetical protein